MSGATGPPSPIWGSLDQSRPRRRQSVNGGITFLVEAGSHTPPYVTSPVSTHRSSSEAAIPTPHEVPYGSAPSSVDARGAGLGHSPPQGQRNFLARFQSNIRQLAVPQTELVAAAETAVEAGAALPLRTVRSPSSPSTATPAQSQQAPAASSPLLQVPVGERSIGSTPQPHATPEAIGPASSATALLASASRRSSLHRSSPHSSSRGGPQQSRRLHHLANATAAANTASLVREKRGGQSGLPKAQLLPGTPNASMRPQSASATGSATQPEMSAEVFSASLLPATQFLQHTMRARAEEEADATDSGIRGAGPRSHTTNPDGGGGATAAASAGSTGATATRKPAPAAVTLLDRGYADEATALHRQRERNNYFIQKHMQNVDAARQSQQELKSFERTLRQMEDRNTMAVRRRRLRRRGPANRRASAGATTGAKGVDRDGSESHGDADRFAEDEDDVDEDDAADFDEDSDDGEADQATNRVATDRTLREAAESWAAVQRLQMENPHITRTLQQEVRASQARLLSSRTRRIDAAYPTSSGFTTPSSSPRMTRRPQMMDEPTEISWGASEAGAGAGATLDRKSRPTARPDSIKEACGELIEVTSALPQLGDARTLTSPRAHNISASSEAALLRADGVIDAYLGQAGAGLRNLGKPRVDGTPVRSMEEQLEVLLEYGNGTSVYHGYKGDTGALPMARAPHVSASAAAKQKKAPPTTSAHRTSSTPPASSTAGRVSVVEAGAPLPALSPSKIPRRASSSQPMRLPLSDGGGAAVHVTLHEEEKDEDGATAQTSPTKAGKRVTFTQPTTHKAVPHRSSQARASVTLTSDGLTSAAREVKSQATDATTEADEAEGKASTHDEARASSKRRSNAAAKPRRRYKRASKGHAPLPAALGVANRSAALLQHEILTGRRRNLEMEVSKASDMSRSVKLLSDLHPLREELLRRDITAAYQTNPPSTWPALYDTAQGGGGSGAEKGALARAGGQPTDVEGWTPLPTWATPQQVLDAHQKIILGNAVEVDARQRRDARLLYVDVLGVMCEERVPEECRAALLATLAHAHEILEYTPHLQNFSGFKTAVTSHIPNQQLVSWPVQEVLQHLSHLFKVPNAVYKDWLGNVFVQLGNRHDYEARFRVVDRTIKYRDVPQEANVRLTLHLCRRLPRVLILANMPVTASGASGNSGGTGRLPALGPVDTPLKTVTGSPTAASAARTSESGNTSSTHFGASTSTSLLPADWAALTGASTAVSSFTALTPTGAPGGAMGGTAGLSGGHEYAIRVQAERQTVTSSAVPAGASPGRTNSTSAGRDGSGSSTATSGGAGVGASKRVVNFADQTFKLHLYDTASQIFLTLLQDSQPIADGRFTVQRYGNGRATQLWLPLEVCPGTTLASGAGSTGSHGRYPELKLTVEVLHDKNSTTGTV